MKIHAKHMLVIWTLCACSSDVASEQARWQDKQPDTYVAELCGTGFGMHTCTRVAVQRAKVVKQSQQDDRDATQWRVVPVKDAHSPLDAAFDAEDDMSGCTLKREFDPDYGFVRKNYFDCGEEGSGTVVSCFVPNTLDLDACPTT